MSSGRHSDTTSPVSSTKRENDERNTLGESLRIAVVDNNINDVQRLLEAGANPSYVHDQDCSGFTPLHYAAAEGCVDAMRLLLNNTNGGVDVSAHGDAGTSPLHLATCSGHIDAVRMLLEAGADPTNFVDDGQKDTPLHIAAELGHSEIIKLLVSRDPNGVSTQKW